LVSTLTVIGEILFHEKRLYEALSYYYEATCLAEAQQNHIQLVRIHLNLGEAEMQLGNLDISQAYLEMALQEAEKAQDPYGLQVAHFLLGCLYVKMGRFNKGEAFLRKVWEWTQLYEKVELQRDVARELGNLMTQKGRWQEAYKFGDIERKLAGKLFDENIQKAVQKFEFQYNLKQLELGEAERRGRYQAAFDAEIAAKSRQQKLLLVVLGITLLIAVLLYRNITLTRRTNKQLKDMHLVISQKNAEITELNEGLEAKVQERTHVLSRRNEQLKQYAFMNSHLVRAPLSNILGIFRMREEGMLDSPEMETQFLDMAAESAEKMDEVIWEISDKLNEEGLRDETSESDIEDDSKG